MKLTDDEIMRLLREHLPHAYLNSPSAAIRFAREVLAAPSDAAQAPIYQTGWPSPENVWGDVDRQTYDSYAKFGYTRRRVLYAAPAATDAVAQPDERAAFYRKALYQIAYWVDDGNNSERKIREFALSVLDGEPAPQAALMPTNGMDRGEFHDKAWALWHAKALDSALLPKLSIHAIRTLWDVLYDAMPRAASQPTAKGGERDMARALESVRDDNAEHASYRHWANWFVNHAGHPMEPVDAWQVRAVLGRAAAPQAGLTGEQRAAIQTAADTAHRVLCAGGDYGDELSDDGLRRELKAARDALRALLAEQSAAPMADADARVAVEFYMANPSAALMDLKKRIAPPASEQADAPPSRRYEYRDTGPLETGEPS